MAKWIILGILLLIIAVLSIPICAFLKYDDGHVRVYYCFLFLKFKLYDSKKPQKQKKTKKSKTDNKPQKKKRKFSFSLVKNSVGAVKLFFEKTRVTSVVLQVAVGGEDAYKTAVTYGALSAVGYPIIGFLNSVKKIKFKRVWLFPDFLSEKTRIKASFKAKLNVINILKILLKVVLELSKTQETKNEKEGNENGKSVNSGNSLNLNEQTSRTR